MENGSDSEMTDHMNKHEDARRNVSIRRIIIIMALVTTVISILLLTATYYTDAGYTRLNENMERYIQWQRDANDLQNGSDYLTEQVRCFVVTGERQYLDDYFEEAQITQRRDRAVSNVRALMGETQAYDSLVSALEESVDLMNREYYAMRLAVSAYGYDLSEYPLEIQEVALSEKDAAAPAEAQRETARTMVFDDVYHQKKEAISGNIRESLTAMDAEMSDRQALAKDNMRRILVQQRVMIVMTILMIISALLMFFMLVVGPLLKAITYIQKDEPLPVEGAKEFRFLAREYNIIHATNLEQKKELAYEATHDNLTGVYNRNGYDSIQRNVDWRTCALVLFDVDSFKPVNDTYGHKMGDRVLQRTARVIQNAFRAQDYVCRIGGDEFAVIMKQVNTDFGELIREKVRKINDELTVPQGDMPGIHVSSGVAYGAKISDFDRLFHEADAAMYRVKRRGGCDCEVRE